MMEKIPVYCRNCDYFGPPAVRNSLAGWLITVVVNLPVFFLGDRIWDLHATKRLECPQCGHRIPSGPVV